MKGSFYTIEAAIAAVMMVITLMFFFQRAPDVVELSKTNYKIRIYNALKISDDVGDLRKNALDNNATAIESDLSSSIPTYVDYNVTIYNTTSNLTVMPTISAEDIITVSYLLAGKVGNYTAREVRVFAWGLD